MRFCATVWSRPGEPTQVVVEVEPDSTVAELGDALAAVVGAPRAGLWGPAGRLDDTARLSQTRLGEGAELWLHEPSPASRPGTRGWQLHVVAGSRVGLVWDLPVGVHEVGRTAALTVEDPWVSRVHVRITVTAEGATVTDHSTNGTTLDGLPLGPEGAPLRPGQLLVIGDTALVVATARAADAAVATGHGGVVEFTRSPRIRPGRPPSTVVVPAPPEVARHRAIPVAALLVPLVLGVVMAVVTSQLQFLLFTAMSPVLLVANLVSERRGTSKQGRESQRSYEQRAALAAAALADGLAQETARRRGSLPDGAATLLTALLPTRQLWERRRYDEDALQLRVGLDDQPSELTVTSDKPGRPAEHRTVAEVPVGLSLRDVGVLGVAGDVTSTRPCAWWLLAQLATFHAPRDLALTVLAPRDGVDWEWVRWLPHARPAEGEAVTASVGTDGETVAARVAELTQLLRARRDAAASGGRVDRSVFPAHVVVLDGARGLRSVPGVSALLTEGPDLGIFALCLESEERLLPEECTATLTFDAADRGRVAVHATGQLPREGVRVELMQRAEAERIARSLAPVRDINPEEGETLLPDTARLLEVLALEPPTVDAVRARWQRGGRSTTMRLGVCVEGAFELDLRRDGPHGLVAGTTGSGKSELLQTMIASLAVANRPDQMTFVLVDYKGGSAFKDCVRLPHTVGMVTDLDPHLVTRALTSLGAELRRREHLLAAAGVKDVEDYQALDARTPGGLPPLPRLLLVIDEFASLARELPDFVTGLVNIAQRGRSLGLHLLLATQRPSGVISPDIRANTNLRISLRVTDAGDSSDVLDASDAARISASTPGRGYVRLGHGALQPFQAGRVGGRRPGVVSTARRPPFVAPLGWGQLGRPAPQPPSYDVQDDEAPTDLAVLVDVLGRACEQEGLAPQPSPWLDPLPSTLLLSELPVDQGRAPAVRLPWGLEDVPAEQEQRLRVLDLAADGHLLVVGAARSGRSQLLRTLAASLSTHSPEDVHVYGVDCGNGALGVLAELPHCGAVVTRGEPERAVRLFARLAQESSRRQALLSSSGYADIAEQRASAADPLPHVVVMIDRWEGFTSTLGELDGGALTDAVLALLREGASVGIHLVVAGDRSLTSSRMSSATESKIALRLADRGDVSMLGLHPRDLPDDQPPGRAVTVNGRREVQTAVLVPDLSGQAQASALSVLAQVARARHPVVRHAPFRVDGLPTAVPLAEALARVDDVAGSSGLFVPFGIGGDDLQLVGVDLGDVPAAVVAGPSGSGRSTLLGFVVQALLAQGTSVVVVAPRPSPLRSLVGTPGVTVLTDPAADLEVWQAALSTPGPLVVVVDDGEGLRDSPGGPLLVAIAKGLGGEGRGLLLGGNTEGLCAGFTGWQVEVKKARQGALLSPRELVDGDLLGVRLPRSAVGGQVSPGRALVHRGGSLVAVTVPR